MPYTITEIITSVRNLLPNIESTQLTDAEVTDGVLKAKRQLDRNFPREYWERLPGENTKIYDLSEFLTNWDDSFSKVKDFAYPAPDVTSETELIFNPRKEVRIWDNGNSNLYARFNSTLSSDYEVLIAYTTRWAIQSLDGAAATTLPEALRNAIEFLSTAYACYMLAGKMSGTVDSQIPGDLLNFRSKESEYRRVGHEWETKYKEEIGLAEGVRAALVRADYDFGNQSGTAYLTHGGR